MSTRLKRWERNEIHQITKSWVEEQRHRLTERDVELVRILAKRKLMRRDQIQLLHPGFRNLANPEIQVNRRLRTLFDYCFIDRAFPNVLPGEGSSQAVISLDRAGAMILGVPFKRVIKHQKDRLGNIHRVLPIDYKHTLGIHDFEVSLINYCQSSGMELIRWRLEYENLRRFQFNGERKIRPDGFGIVRLPDGKGKSFYFEYDTGSEDIRGKSLKRIKEKFTAYAAFKKSGAWIQEDWAKILRSFPVVIFLTEDKRRVPLLQEIATMADLRIVVEKFSNRSQAIQKYLT